MEKVFNGSSKEEASRKANEWVAEQKGFREIERRVVALSDEGPSLLDADQWAVTIHYEYEDVLPW